MAENTQKNPTVRIKEAAELSGLSIHMLTYLGRIGVAIPTHGGGRGKARLYTFSDVLFLRAIADLLARGIEVKKLGKALRIAQQNAETWIDIHKTPRHYLVTDGTEVFIHSHGDLESKTLNGQLAFAFVLDLAAAHETLSNSWPDEKKASAVRRRQ